MISTRMKQLAEVVPTLMIVILRDFADLAQLVPDPGITQFSLT